MPNQDIFNQNGQVPGNPQSTNWMWGNQSMPTNPFQTPQQYTTTGGSELDPEYVKKLNDLLAKGYSQESARKVIAWEQNTLQAPIYEPNVGVDVNEENRQAMEWYDNMIGKKPSVAPWAGEENPNNIDDQGRLLYSGDRSDLTGSEGVNNYEKLLPFLSPTGSSLETELFMTGRALGQEKGTPGRGLAIAGGIGAAALGASRAGLSGYALSKANQTQEQWMRDQLAKGRTGTYTAAPQYGNSNSLGGTSFENGGLFADGGFTSFGDDKKKKKPTGEEVTYDYMKADLVERPALMDYQKTDAYKNAPVTGRNYLDWKHNNPLSFDPDTKTWYSAAPEETTSGTHYLNSKDAYEQYIDALPKNQFSYGFTVTDIIDPETGLPVKVPADVMKPRIGVTSLPPAKGFRYGGLFEEGGEQMQTPAPQQGGQEEQMQQIAMMAQQMLSQGATPEQVMQALVSQGVPQEVAQQILQQIMQPAQQPQMAYGGLFQDTNSDPVVNFNKNVGDKVEFSVGTKKYKGKIKKIENGKFYI